MTDLPLTWESRLEKAFFIPGSSNQEAYHWINAPSWPFRNLWLYGPQGCGKSHMGSIWADKNQATRITAPLWPQAGPLTPFVWIDFNDLATVGCEKSIFSFLQSVHNGQCYSLWTSRYAPRHFDFVLKDVASRIKAMMCVQVMKPDDVLFAKVLVKSLADIGWILSDKKLYFLAMRMPRSFESIAWAVDFIRLHAEPHSLSFQTLHRLVTYLDHKNKQNRLYD